MNDFLSAEWDLLLKPEVEQKKEVPSNMVTIDGKAIYTGYVKIDNLAQFRTTPPLISPDHPGYLPYWALQSKRCIEGMWSKMFGKWRFMRPNLYFYMNFGIIEQTDRGKRTQLLKPEVSDLEWELSYGLMTARGFSGFTKDEEYTSIVDVPLFLTLMGEQDGTAYLRVKYPEAFNSNGDLKKFMTPLENCRRLHDNPVGIPHYLNQTENFMAFGSRGGGKSYLISIGEILHGLLFDGATVYDEAFVKNKLTASFCVGSSDSEKSSEFCAKLEASLNIFAHPDDGKQFGVWGRPLKSKTAKSDYSPCPFFRKFKGTLDVSNKTNQFEYTYEIVENGIPIEKGTHSKLAHVNYAAGKARDTGAQAASGGRYLVSVIEEFGLAENGISIHTSNEATVAREGVRFGTEIYIGTSGNIRTVHAARKMFLNPQDYKILAYPNHHGDEGKDKKIGFFLPFYMTLRQYKDINGNTNYEEAAAHVNRLREKCKESTDPKILQDEQMNRPCYVDEMWLTPGGSIMPVVELQNREKELLKDNLYKRLGTCVKLHWDSNQPYKVGYTVDHDAEPYTEFPIDFSKRKNPQGCPVIYHPPQFINGAIPEDMYSYVGHDSYIQEDITKGGSVGATYIMCNPKYLPFGFPGNQIVASYIDKPLAGLDAHYENQEKLLALYGNPKNGLWYEANRGQDCKNHYTKKGKVHLLAPTPQLVQSENAFQKQISSYGYHTGSQMHSKSQMARWIRDWLLRATLIVDQSGFGQDVTILNLEMIPCLFLIRQLIAYNLTDNFDAVDGFRGCIVGIMNDEIRAGMNESNNTIADDRLKFFLDNPKFFNNDRRNNPQRQGHPRGLFTTARFGKG